MQAVTLTLSTYHPSIPPQPSRPMSNRSWSRSPLTPALARLTCDCPQDPVTSPPSVPVKPDSPAIGFVLPSATVASRSGLLKVNAERGMSRHLCDGLVRNLTLPPSKPSSVAA